MKRILITLMCFLLIGMTFSSCKKVKGCMDTKALNMNFEAEKEDGSCTYSKAIFYMSVIDLSRPVTVTVNGSNIGTITAQYPNGPGNCIAPGCAEYQFKNGGKIDWVATEPGGLIWTGTVEPNAYNECIKVRIY